MFFMALGAIAYNVTLGLVLGVDGHDHHHHGHGHGHGGHDHHHGHGHGHGHDHHRHHAPRKSKRTRHGRYQELVRESDDGAALAADIELGGLPAAAVSATKSLNSDDCRDGKILHIHSVRSSDSAYMAGGDSSGGSSAAAVGGRGTPDGDQDASAAGGGKCGSTGAPTEHIISVAAAKLHVDGSNAELTRRRGHSSDGSSDADSDSDDSSHDGGHHHHHRNLNLRSAFIHVLGDLVQSIGVAIAGVLIWTHPNDPRWYIADPACTYLFAVMVLATTRGVLRDVFDVLMERCPDHVDMQEARKRLQAVSRQGLTQPWPVLRPLPLWR